MAADHHIDRAIEFLDDVDDRAGDAGAFIVVAGRETAFMDQHHDGLDAARLQFGQQRVHGVGLVPEFQVGHAGRRDQVRRAFQGQADESHGNAAELPDRVGGKHGLAGALLEGAGGEIAKFGAEERMRPLASVDRMTAAILHPQQLVLALVEFVIADGGHRKPHHIKRFDGGLVVKHRRQERAGADQVAGGDEDRVAVSFAELPDRRRHVLGAAGFDGDLFGLVVGIGDPDSARRRLQIAVEIIDGQNAQFDRRGLRRRARRGRRRQHDGGKDQRR